MYNFIPFNEVMCCNKVKLTARLYFIIFAFHNFKIECCRFQLVTKKLMP